MIDDDCIGRLFQVEDFIEPMRRAFATGCRLPQRVQVPIEVSESSPATLLVMPAWTNDHSLGIKLATVFPDNARSGMPTVSSVYVLMSAKTGKLLAIFTGAALTLNRTAAVSALGSDLLACSDVETLLLVGTGELISYLARAHASVRSFKQILVWGRSYEKAVDKAEQVERNVNIRARAVVNLEPAVRNADVISTATLSEAPLIDGAWLKVGAHLDLVGSFKETMRESDDIAAKQSRIFVDTFDAVHESGDLTQPIANGTILASHILGDLSDLTNRRVIGRRTPADRTLFKSVGTALADLAAATLILERLNVAQASGSIP